MFIDTFAGTCNFSYRNHEKATYTTVFKNFVSFGNSNRKLEILRHFLSNIVRWLRDSKTLLCRNGP